MTAYAIAITEENLKGIIRSEAGKNYDLQIALEWLLEHEEGWFIRDLGSPFDCEFFMPEIFIEIYVFLNNDKTSILRQVLRK